MYLRRVTRKSKIRNKQIRENVETRSVLDTDTENNDSQVDEDTYKKSTITKRNYQWGGEDEDQIKCGRAQ